MFFTWQQAGFWLVHSAFAGGLLLLLTRGLMTWTRQPALRQRLGECGLAAALAAAGMCLLPAWLVLPWGWEAPAAVSQTKNPAPGVAAAQPVHVAPVPASRPRNVAEVPVFWPLFLPNPAPQDTAAPAQPTPRPAAWVSVERWEFVALVFFLVYLGGLAWFLARLALGLLYLRRLVRDATPAPAWIADLLEESAATEAPPRLVISRRLRSPLSFGLFRPTIALPAALCADTDHDALRWVLRHERTHLERRDAWSGLLCAVTRAVYFFVPWTWSVCRQVRLCQEYLADAAAVDGEDRRADYAEFLLTLTKTVAPPLVATGVSGNCSDLFRRVTMLLEKSVPVQGRAARRLLVPAAFLLLALAVLVSGLGLRALAADSPVAVNGVVQPDQPAAVKPVPANPQQGGFGQAGQLQIGAGIQLPGGGFGAVQIQPFPMPGAGGFGGIAGNPFALPGFDELKKAADKMQNAKTPDEIKAAQLEVMKALQKFQANPGMIGVGGIGGFGPAGALPIGGGFGPGIGGFGGGLFNQQARLGVQLTVPAKVVVEQLNLPQGQGLVVSHVLLNSAAAKAGLKANDILLKFDGKTVPNNVQAFNQIVELAKTETPLNVVVLRKGKEETVQGVSLPKQVPQQPNAFGGFGAGGFVPVPIGPGGFGGGIGGAGFGGAGGAFGGIGLPGGGNFKLVRNQDGFDCQYQNGQLSITITGPIDANNKGQVGNIQIQEGDQINNYKTVQEVPAAHRHMVYKMMEHVNKSKIALPNN